MEWSPGSIPPSNPVKDVMCTLYIPQNEPDQSGAQEHTVPGCAQRKYVFDPVGNRMSAQIVPYSLAYTRASTIPKDADTSTPAQSANA